MSRFKVICGTIACLAAAGISTASEGEQQPRVAPISRPAPNPVQVQMQDPAARSKVEAAISGISLNDVMAMAARLENAPRDAAIRERRDAREEASGQTVSRAQIDALVRSKPLAREVAAPGNKLPPPKPQIRRPTPRPVPPGSGQLAAPPRPTLDVAGFGEDLHQALSGNVQG